MRILTYNVWTVPVVAKDKHSRLRALPGALSRTGADLIALQEVWTDAAVEALTLGLAKKGYPTVARIPGNRGWIRGRMGNGLMMFSRHPLVSPPTHMEFSKATYLNEVPVRKGALHACFDFPGIGPVDCFNTHLGAVRFHKDGTDYRTDRAHQDTQLQELIEFVRAKSGDRPLLLMGDFNFHDWERFDLTPLDSENVRNKSYKRLIDDLQLVDLHPSYSPTGPSVVTFSKKNAYVAQVASQQFDDRLDYVFLGARGPMGSLLRHEESAVVLQEEHRAIGRPLSDHYGVLVELSVRAP